MYCLLPKCFRRWSSSLKTIFDYGIAYLRLMWMALSCVEKTPAHPAARQPRDQGASKVQNTKIFMGFCGLDYVHLHKAVFVIVVMTSGSNFANKWDPVLECRWCDRSCTLQMDLVLFSCNSCWNRWKLKIAVPKCRFQCYGVRTRLCLTVTDVRIGVGGKTGIRSVDRVPKKETCYLETLERN